MRDTIKFTLTPDEYVALAQLAEQECRPVPMQAQHIVKEAIRRNDPPKEPTPNREGAEYARR